MKERLNLTIDGALLEAMKAYAASKQMSVSELVESYFRQVTKPVQRENLLELVERLPGAGGRELGIVAPVLDAMTAGGESEAGLRLAGDGLGVTGPGFGALTPGGESGAGAGDLASGGGGAVTAVKKGGDHGV